ncbi:MAG: Rdx family protein [Kofleriaceae bacterium]|nr:Rdx family protein [Kofleriaceae bacterium]MBP6836752.1 Rdx family protein [Kofleriaceae bacterium]MBP9207011.1 Rdx family protein [Kofleriaceae bacterium]
MVGDPGEFSVWVGGREVVRKQGAFPSPDAIIAAVRAALAPT